MSQRQQRTSKRHITRCTTCGYETTGVVAGSDKVIICPECGNDSELPVPWTKGLRTAVAFALPVLAPMTLMLIWTTPPYWHVRHVVSNRVYYQLHWVLLALVAIMPVIAFVFRLWRGGVSSQAYRGALQCYLVIMGMLVCGFGFFLYLVVLQADV